MSELKVYPQSDDEAYIVIKQLPSPLNTILVEQKSGEYKDFHIAPGDPYPMKGVMYCTNYGFLPGYTGEDGHGLDFFVGTDPENGKMGYLLMDRPDIGEDASEHKFFVALTKMEHERTLIAFQGVLRGQKQYENIEELLKEIIPFQNLK